MLLNEWEYVGPQSISIAGGATEKLILTKKYITKDTLLHRYDWCQILFHMKIGCFSPSWWQKADRLWLMNCWKLAEFHALTRSHDHNRTSKFLSLIIQNVLEGNLIFIRYCYDLRLSIQIKWLVHSMNLIAKSWERGRERRWAYHMHRAMFVWTFSCNDTRTVCGLYMGNIIIVYMEGNIGLW